MITKYSYDNVEAMINSIHSNSKLINSMMSTTRENDRLISEKMKSYAMTKSVFSQSQIELYKSYAEHKSDVETAFNAYSKDIENIGSLKQLELHKSGEAINNIHNIFSKINTLQIKIMEMLCTIIGRANVLIASI